MLTVLENCRISPPPATVGERSLPLTFFDTVWLLFFPIHQVFFYEFPHSKQDFIQTIVPKLKDSLSITLQHFFPFASNLIVYPNPNHHSIRNPEIRHVDGDAVAVTFAECGLDFADLTGNHPRGCNKFYPLVPALPSSTKESDHVSIPLFSVQVTLFEDAGFAIGLTNHHSLCDASTRFNFLKAWTSIARNGSDEEFLSSGSLPVYDRVIKYPTILDEIHLNQPGIETIKEGCLPPYQLDNETDKVRATFVLTQTHINRLKKTLRTQNPNLEYVSSFSVACAFVWSCTAKSLEQIGEKKGEDDIERFVCAIDWRSRIDPPIPQTYFGNCVGACITPNTKSKDLASKKGFLVAAELFGNALSETIKNKEGMFKDAETWLKRASEPVASIGVSGTPKTKIYDVDFGWGKPKKHETVSIDYNRSISVNACKESSTDIEIGLSLPVKQMDAFITIFDEELKSTFSGQEC